MVREMPFERARKFTSYTTRDDISESDIWWRKLRHHLKNSLRIPATIHENTFASEATFLAVKGDSSYNH